MVLRNYYPCSRFRLWRADWLSDDDQQLPALAHPAQTRRSREGRVMGYLIVIAIYAYILRVMHRFVTKSTSRLAANSLFILVVVVIIGSEVWPYLALQKFMVAEQLKYPNRVLPDEITIDSKPEKSFGLDHAIAMIPFMPNIRAMAGNLSEFDNKANKPGYLESGRYTLLIRRSDKCSAQEVTKKYDDRRIKELGIKDTLYCFKYEPFRPLSFTYRADHGYIIFMNRRFFVNYYWIVKDGKKYNVSFEASTAGGLIKMPRCYLQSGTIGPRGCRHKYEKRNTGYMGQYGQEFAWGATPSHKIYRIKRRDEK
jgi:hypothetical protein